MSEFEEKLGAILGDQNAMAQIMSLAQSLGGGTSTPPEGESAPAPSAPPSGDLSALLGSLDPQLLQSAARLYAQLSASEDQRAALLLALKPFLREERYAKVDRAIQIARLSRVLRVGLALWKEKGEENV